MKCSIRIVLLAGATAACGVTEPIEEPAQDARWVSLGKECTADAPVVPLDPILVASLPEPRFQTVDVHWAELAGRVPGGWGGFFYEGGVPTIYLVDPARREEAIEALRSEGIPASTSTVVKQGRWDFAQLYDWYRFLAAGALALEGVTFTDIQESRNRLEIGAVDEEARGRLEQMLSALDLPCFLVATEIRGYVSVG